jgi:hypothetical protein
MYGVIKRYLWSKLAWQIIKIPLRIKSQPK